MLDAVDAGLDAVIVRPPWFYGPYQPARQTTFFRMVRTGRFPVIGDGGQRRSMVYVDNLVDGVVARRADADAAPGAAGGSPTPGRTTVDEIVATVGRALAAEGFDVTPNRAPPARRSPAASPSAPTRSSSAPAATSSSSTCSARWTRRSPATSPSPAAELGYEPAGRRSRRACGAASAGASTRGSSCDHQPRHRRQRLLRVAARRAPASTRGDDVRRARHRRRRRPAGRRRGRARPTSATRPRSRGAVDGVDVVYHNVAQVPLATRPDLLRTVNVDGTRVLLDACARRRRRQGRAHVVERRVRRPGAQPGAADDRAPAAGGLRRTPSWPPSGPACAPPPTGLDVTIVRPRTILGHGRLGIFGILFDWIADGADPIVLGDGSNRYQFVHADDLADVCLLAADAAGPGDLQRRHRPLRHDARGARRTCARTPAPAPTVRSLPAGPAALGDAGQRRRSASRRSPRTTG